MKRSALAAVLVLVVSTAFAQNWSSYSIGFRFQNGAVGSTAHTYFAEDETVIVEYQVGEGPIQQLGTFRVSELTHVIHAAPPDAPTVTFPALEVKRTITAVEVASGIRMRIRNVSGTKVKGARGMAVYAFSTQGGT